MSPHRHPTAITASAGRPVGRAAAALVLVLVGALALLAGPAAAQDESRDAGVVDVIEVSGLLDPVLADYVDSAIADAEARGSRALVLQMNSTDAVITADEVVALAERIRTASIDVTVWVGPSGSSAKGRAGQLLGAADLVGIAPGSRIGDLGELVVDPATFTEAWATAAPGLVDQSVGRERAIELGIARDAPTIGEFLVQLEGFESATETDEEGNARTVPVTQVRFAQLPLVDQLFHTIASPAVAYLCFLIGMGLLVFELYTAGVGIAGVLGALFFIAGAYGLDVLPARGWAVALLVFAMFGFAVDVQVGVPRVWTGIGVVSLIVGSLYLYEDVGMSWITLLAGVVGMSVAMISGMPAMVRTRFSTPTIGREWMIGEMGSAVEDVSPEGLVSIRDATWRARTNRATPITAGEPVRVVSIEGVVLEVEPEEGAARDYRDRARGRD